MAAFDPSRFSFRLYVAGESNNSLQAISNLNALCHDLLPGCHDIEIVDVLREPRRALDEHVLLTPTLIKVSPLPTRKIIGNLGDRAAVSRSLGLDRP